MFEADNILNVTELRNLISKSASLKRESEEKESALDGILDKKKLSVKKKEELSATALMLF